MKQSVRNLFAILPLAMASAAPALAADAYPSRPVRIVVNTGPGGLVDFTTRLVAQEMSVRLKQQVIVENRAGGDGMIGINVVKAAPADGYTLLASAGTMTYQQVLKKDAGYDVTKDFTGIGFLGKSPLLLVVAPDSPNKTAADFIKNAKANPNKLTYASAGVGTGTHIGAALYLQRAGLQLLHVPYKGNGPAMPDVMSGRVSMIFEAYGSGKGYLAGGKLRALGVSSTTRVSTAPDIPTLAEQGVPGYSFYTWMGLVAPAGTPKEVVQKLSEALHAVYSNNALKERFKSEGIEDTFMSPSVFNAFMAKEVEDVTRLSKEIKLEKQ
ncbi:Bug family tripartite tricarboxylate transporter substrate binding protein [Cupriavidus basilensis]|uniref:Bug family tripartite tricarboxylate transporter substrate binding protein n=1 Tax=Cupriavidus basilensis TaxID=68895 RepID=UPI0023E87527|nr:tripartite tricarboxylate transporter substrate binding protein [Cupriavidus basilensis]MDF3885195.1 tripartite tricarboxylate transporter substrate binding protein [Cupriavidus basilensis]